MLRSRLTNITDFVCIRRRSKGVAIRAKPKPVRLIVNDADMTIKKPITISGIVKYWS
jgi:hypothetical protein